MSATCLLIATQRCWKSDWHSLKIVLTRSNGENRDSTGRNIGGRCSATNLEFHNGLRDNAQTSETITHFDQASDGSKRFVPSICVDQLALLSANHIKIQSSDKKPTRLKMQKNKEHNETVMVPYVCISSDGGQGGHIGVGAHQWF